MRRHLLTGVLLTTLCAAPTASFPVPAAAAPSATRPAAAMTVALDLQQRHQLLLGQARETATLRASALERAMAAELVPLAGAAVPGSGDAAARAATARARAEWLTAQAGVDALTALVAVDAARAAEAQAHLRMPALTAGSSDGTWRGLVPGGGAADPRAVGAVRFALAQSGEPYLWGATGPDRWDCSGLMQAAYRSVGVALPRVSRQQFWAGPRVARSDLLPGDLVFLASVPGDPSTIHHVGMVIGGGRMVHAPKTGDVVRVAGIPVSGYAGAVRVLPARAVETEVPPDGTGSAPPAPLPSDPLPSDPPPTDAPPTDPPPAEPPPTLPPTLPPPLPGLPTWPTLPPISPPSRVSP